MDKVAIVWLYSFGRGIFTPYMGYMAAVAIHKS